MAGASVRAYFFAGPAGRLEALWKAPESISRGSAVVAHAHPLHGGTMHFKVIFRIARELSNAGFGVLRFNFRGVGSSEGVHDGGRGEREDFRAALKEARSLSGLPQIAAGFSFGSAIALSAGAREPDVLAVVAAGVPLDCFPLAEVGRVAKPVLFVSGRDDEFGNPARLREEVQAAFSDPEIVVVPDADHFFTGRLDDLGDAVARFVARVAAEVPR
jgi:alpha/beta superfamily hydrolase